MKLKHDKVIVFHPGANGMGLAFDVFAKRGKRVSKKLREMLYEANCDVVKKVLQENPDYEYLGSEDLMHTPAFNFGVIQLLIEFHKRGFEFVYYDISRKVGISTMIRQLAMLHMLAKGVDKNE